jgi:methylmalonyl-CoA mutase N-terminal domain/subunit
MESEALAYFEKLDALGGMVPAIERGFPQGEIHRAAVSYQKEIDSGEKLIVGVNSFVEPQERRIAILKVKDDVEKKQVLKLRQRRKSRSAKKVASELSRLANVAGTNGDLMPAVMEAVRVEATVGEICNVFRSVYGDYREAALI